MGRGNGAAELGSSGFHGRRGGGVFSACMMDAVNTCRIRSFRDIASSATLRSHLIGEQEVAVMAGWGTEHDAAKTKPREGGFSGHGLFC
jgi:hypothetical protein